ncbi:Diphthine synthase [Candidatus Anstonella stagnisolia]|nr:Diphthine synthase [Candidatus Anstonella stagnisolia]
MLYLIGIGICDETDMSLRALEVLKKCSIVFAESYTSILSEGTLSRLEKLCKKKIKLLKRADVENEKEILSACSDDASVCLLVAGDPLIATTHVSLLLAAQKKNIPTKVIHSSSILSAAIGESGLQAYRFGKIVTIPKWKPNYTPSSPYDTIQENLSRNLHTLLLLDLDEKGEHLEPKEALRELLSMEEEKKKGIILHTTNFVLLSRVGWPTQRRIYSSLAALLDGHTDDLPAILILPAKLHFMEEEFLAEFAMESGL